MTNFIGHSGSLFRPGPVWGRTTLRSVLILLLCLLLVFFPLADMTLGATKTELKAKTIKAAMIFKFLMFVEWPKGVIDEKSEEIRIGVVGEEAAAIAVKAINGKQSGDLKVVVVPIKLNELHETLKQAQRGDGRQIAALQQLHALYFTETEKVDLSSILELLRQYPILVIGEQNRFLEQGGMINFVLDDATVKFEINLDNVESAKLKIRSQLLRLARKVIHKGKVRS